jgi:hypothetical protein
MIVHLVLVLNNWNRILNFALLSDVENSHFVIEVELKFFVHIKTIFLAEKRKDHVFDYITVHYNITAVWTVW